MTEHKRRHLDDPDYIGALKTIGFVIAVWLCVLGVGFGAYSLMMLARGLS